jgi:ferredoxin-thioredoxin reductase catalytic subunit
MPGDDGPGTAANVDRLVARLKRDAEASGYYLNPDEEFVRALVEGLIANTDRYGYEACPCRLAEGDRDLDLDIICPCDYRDADLVDWGACYCALYVSQSVADGAGEAQPIPDRRPPGGRPRGSRTPSGPPGAPLSSLPVWRCRVCGYLCAREHPPGVCPICKARQDRFEQFW